jgi:hypothetical protein
MNRGDDIDRRMNLLLQQGVVLLPTMFFIFLDRRQGCRQLRLRHRVRLRQVVVGGSGTVMLRLSALRVAVATAAERDLSLWNRD